MDRVEETWAMITPADLMRLVIRRWPSVLGTMLLVSVGIAAVLLVWPNQYGSDGLMYVRLGRGALSADPAAAESSAISMQESRSFEVVSIAEMMGSREIAERTVERVGIDDINQPRNWIERAVASLTALKPSVGSSSETMSAEDCDQQLARENAIKRVRDAIDISVPKNGYTVAISASGSDPILVRSIVQTVMDEYGSYHVEAHQADGSLEFFEKQVAESQAAALQARQQLQTAKNEMGWLSVESAETTLRERIVQLEISLDDAESALAEAESNSQELQRRIADVDEWIPLEITKGIASNSDDNMRGQLFQLQVEESEMLAKIKPSHPRYRMLQQKMDQSKQIVDDEKKDREQTREALNPVRQELETNYQVAVARVAGLKSRRDALAESLQQANNDLQRLNRDAVTLASLTWQSDIAEKNYLQHAKSLEETRLNSKLDSQNMSDVSVIQDASLNLKKIGPPRLLLATLGGIFGLSLGVFQALLRDKKTTMTNEPRKAEASPESDDHSDSLPAEQQLDLVGAASGPTLPR